MAATRKKYAPEFKLAAVAMIAEEKLSVAEVRRDELTEVVASSTPR